MSLLRASSEAAGLSLDIDATLDSTSKSDAGVPHGRRLLRFATAAQTESADLAEARSELERAVGSDGLVEAAATIAIFNGLVRVADGTGIQLDDGVLSDSADYRERLGVDNYAGAVNSTAKVNSGRATSVAELFSPQS